MMFLVSRALTFKMQQMAAGFTPVMKTSVRYIVIKLRCIIAQYS